MTTPTTVRNADLTVMLERLRKDQARKLDLVVPAGRMHSSMGQLVIKDGHTTIDENGVGQEDLRVEISQTMLGQMAGRLGIPVRYLSKLSTVGAERDAETNFLTPRAHEALALLDRNVNDWLRWNGGSHMVRTFEPDELDELGLPWGRALLSDRYRVIDDLDVLTSALDGLRESDPTARVVGADLSENRMRVRVASTSVKALAPTLLKGYRSPYGGAEGTDNPTVFAGFEISNSETGGGSFTIVPRLVVEICSNGMRMTKDATKKIHLGAKLDEGMVNWSQGTLRKSMELVRAQTTDAVRTFMDTEYVTRKLAEMEEAAQVEVTQPMETIKVVQSTTKWSDAETDSVLAHFIQGGQLTAGGIMHAATAFAQQVADPDRASELEESAMDAMLVAAAV